MAEFSIQDVAFTGFGVVREHPRALGFWTLYALILSVAFTVIFTSLMGADLAKLQTSSTGVARDPAAILSVFQRLLPAYALFILVATVSNAVLGAAMIRAVLSPADDRLGYLRLGADELRQFALGLLTFAVFIGAYIALFFGVGVFAVILGFMSRSLAAPAVALGFVGVLGGLAFLGVRLSLAPALTFESGRINLVGSWSLTRGRFWPMLGAYTLTLAMVMVVYLLSLLLIFALVAIMNGGNLLTAMGRNPPTDFMAYLAPWRVIQMLLTAVLSALVWPVVFTPPTAIYRRIASSGAPAADGFS